MEGDKKCSDKRKICSVEIISLRWQFLCKKNFVENALANSFLNLGFEPFDFRIILILLYSFFNVYYKKVSKALKLS